MQKDKLSLAILAALAATDRSQKGIIGGTAFVQALVPVLADYPAALDNMEDWLAQGEGKSTSGIKYKKAHNVGIFPSEQVFCNTRNRARRPLEVICRAVAIALLDNIPYNPDRFSTTVSETGLEQGLRQFNVPKEFEVKKDIYDTLPESGLTAENRKAVAALSEEAVESLDAGNRLSFNRSLLAIASMLADAEKRAADKEAAAKEAAAKEAAKPPRVRKTRGKGSQSA